MGSSHLRDGTYDTGLAEPIGGRRERLICDLQISRIEMRRPTDRGGI